MALILDMFVFMPGVIKEKNLVLRFVNCYLGLFGGALSQNLAKKVEEW